jgi:3-oxoacyl-[acyl-carrier protein] reductase
VKALVTGGASGLGEEITRALAAITNAHVTFTYCRSSEKAKQLAAELPNVRAIACDFFQPQEVASVAASIDAWEIDVLVHNATTGMQNKHFHKLDPVVFATNFQVNVSPVIVLSQAAIAAFRKRRRGRIITILSSVLVNRPPVGMSEYTASKAYLHSLAKSWAVENAAFGILSNCVSPSVMHTNLIRDVDERVLSELAAEHPLKRLVSPQEVAETVAFLAGPASAHINGANLILNAAADLC